MAFLSIINRFFPSKGKKVDGAFIEQQAITLTPIFRKRGMGEDERRIYSTELLDTYYGFGSTYLAGHIKQSITNKNIQREMLKIVRVLPLLTFFTNSISRVYSVQPIRKFMLDGKEIISKPKESDKKEKEEEVNKDGDLPFDARMNEDNFIHDDELLDALNNLYNKNIENGIRQAERFTNLMNTTVYKIVTDESSNVKMIFLPNDTVQIKPDNSDLARAEQIAFIQDVVNFVDNRFVKVPIVENWSKEDKSVPIAFADREQEGIDEDDTVNQAAVEYEKLFGRKTTRFAFAPFVVFRDSSLQSDFWDQKNNDVFNFIKSINMSLTELKYLEKFTSFGLKYGINVKMPDDGVIDPNGFLEFAVLNSSVPGAENNKNYEVGEFQNKGAIDEVVKAIIFNLKMLFSMHNIPLDALISTNSIRSAESKNMDTKELFAKINDDRDTWSQNEEDLFGVLQAVHNRDNEFQIPAGIELLVDYEEQSTVEKEAADWLSEIQNNIKTAIDWIASENPDLDRSELMEKLKSNKDINDSQKKEPLDMNAFATMDDDGNMIIPKDPNAEDNNDI